MTGVDSSPGAACCGVLPHTGVNVFPPHWDWHFTTQIFIFIVISLLCNRHTLVSVFVERSSDVRFDVQGFVRQLGARP